MQLGVVTYLIVCPLVFCAGLVDAAAGGGGIISLQAYILAGVPMHFALGTNKLSSVAGTTIAAARYYRNKLVDFGVCVPSVAAALAGSALGTSLTLLIDENILKRLLLFVIPLTAFYVFKNKNLSGDAAPPLRKRQILYAALISFVVGVYDGFFGPGAGTFYILLYTGIAKIRPAVASGTAKFVNFASNFGALVVFLLNGRVIIPLGICAGAFGMLGAYAGSGLVIHRGAKIIRPFILVVLALLFGKIVYDFAAG
ncbi:MAG: TSUP family transporter [Spirochaetaceae bacterium]|jgi:uncharacterized membrane protein YfcA|nr:TSUP family transporter [Spirochaetaceae bacterium]